MPNDILKVIVITIQENKSSFYEYSNGQILHSSNIPNERISEYQDAKATHNHSTSSGELIIDGNDNKWKGEMNNDHLKHVFIHLKTLLLPESKLHSITNILIFFSSNTPKHDLEKVITDFNHEHHKVQIQIVAKNLIDHNDIETAAKSYYTN
jgi:hypothetical protein